MSLRLEFRGWFQMRLATDPDPYDEPRGASGYTFAFGSEPDLDRILRFQSPDAQGIRSHSPEIGVEVVRAFDTVRGTEFAALAGAKLDLLGEPKLENRNRVLTDVGCEPIVPYWPQIRAERAVIARNAWLDPSDPEQDDATKVERAVLQKRGADGYDLDPAGVKAATGQDVSDYPTIIARIISPRFVVLTDELDREADENERAVLEGRIAELRVAIEQTDDRRAMAHQGLEHFGYSFQGPTEVRFPNEDDSTALIGGVIDEDERTPWWTAFDLLGWDADLLCGYAIGWIQIPYQGENAGEPVLTARYLGLPPLPTPG